MQTFRLHFGCNQSSRALTLPPTQRSPLGRLSSFWGAACFSFTAIFSSPSAIVGRCMSAVDDRKRQIKYFLTIFINFQNIGQTFRQFSNLRSSIQLTALLQSHTVCQHSSPRTRGGKQTPLSYSCSCLVAPRKPARAVLRVRCADNIISP